jgi:hypothetical protein
VSMPILSLRTGQPVNPAKPKQSQSTRWILQTIMAPFLILMVMLNFCKIRSSDFDVWKGTESPRAEVSPRVLSPFEVGGFKPYFLRGKLEWMNNFFTDQREFFRLLESEPAMERVPDTVRIWALPKPLQSPTRNHDSVLLESETSQVLVNILGRFSRSVEMIDLLSGTQHIVTSNGTDAAGKPLNDLNHVSAVMVDTLDQMGKEIWLPCGFHGDTVNNETSSEYVRIIDVATMNIRAGPRLPFAGGACAAAAVDIYGSDKAPHICAFGGTHGSHDAGEFLPYVSCYDREAEKWHYPFGALPYGLDHGNAVEIPAGLCSPDDPRRMLILNYRKSSYGNQSSTILGFDFPSGGWSTDASIQLADPYRLGAWYVFANISHEGPLDALNAPRDASGLVVANDGRSVINFGGVSYTYQDRRRMNVFSIVRNFDVCEKKWTKLGDLAMQCFALQSVASSDLNVAFTCGGWARSQSKQAAHI